MRKFKNQIIRIPLLGFTAFCESELGLFEGQCFEFSIRAYKDYLEWAKDETKWGKSLIKKFDFGCIIVVKLPNSATLTNIVSLCTMLAQSALDGAYINNIDKLLSRTTEEICNQLQFEDDEDGIKYE